MSKKDDSKSSSKKKKSEEDVKLFKNPVHEAIDNYHKNQTESDLQSLQPLHVFKTGTYKKPPKEVIIKAFYQWRAIKSHVARNLGCSRVALDDWLKKDPELQEAFEDAREAAIDHAESKLMELIDGVVVQDFDFTGKPVVYKTKPEIKALNLYLSTIGKHRGFTTQTEIKHSGDKDNPLVSVNYLIPNPNQQNIND